MHQNNLSRRGLLTGKVRAREEQAAVLAIEPHCLAFAGTACRSCEDACEPRAIRFRPRTGGHYHPEITSDCTGCSDCIPVCPVGALTFTTGNRDAV
ncbi:4Fe-4S dicluster domain-containing protein [Alphaproteobacteria bacterium HT1-32]|nr:4Fe-4S dicluster domain-containing protein [Alphaproteobacteria bacterium HT1-32]